MKKFLMIGILAVFADSLQLQASGDLLDASGDWSGMISDSFGTDLQEVQTDFIKREGNANRLLMAFGYARPEDMKKMPKKLTESQNWVTRNWNWSDDPSIAQTDDNGNVASNMDVAPTETKKQREDLLKQLKKTYLDKDTYFSNQESLYTLNEDIQALQDKIEVTHNANLRAKLTSLVDIARLFSKQMSTTLASQNLNKKMQSLLPTTSSMRVSKGLLEAEDLLQQAQRRRDEESVNVYKKAQEQLRQIQKEVDKLKRAAGDNFKTEVAKIENVLKKAQDKEQKITDDLNRPAPNSQVRHQILLEQKLYKEVVKELELEKIEANDIKKKKQEVQDKVSANFKGILKDDHGNFIKNPNELLNEANFKLNTLQDELIGLEKENERKAHGHHNYDTRSWVNFQDDKIHDKKEEIQVQERYIDLLKIELKSFDDKVNYEINKLVKEQDGSREKALNVLLADVDKSIFQSVSNYFGSESTQESLIKKMTNPVKKEMALRLQRQIKAELANDPVAVAQNRLAHAKAGEMFGALEGYLEAILSSKFGLSLAKLSKMTRDELTKVLTRVNKEMLAIIDNSRLSDSTKQERKRVIMQKMMEECSDILSRGTTGVSLNTLKGGNAKDIGTEWAISQLLYKLDPTASMPQVPVLDYEDLRSQAYKVLELSSDASQDDIKKAYRSLASKHHPDKGGDTARFQEIANAYQLLSNAE